jgi:hypothetical protein
MGGAKRLQGKNSREIAYFFIGGAPCVRMYSLYHGNMKQAIKKHLFGDETVISK